MRKEVEAQQKKEQEQRLREEKKEEEREARMAAEREAKDAEKQRKREAKDDKGRAGKEGKEKSTKPGKEKKQSAADIEAEADEENLRLFEEKCGEAVDDAKASVKDLIKEASSLLSDKELNTIRPVSRVLQPLLRFCRRKEDTQVISAVKRFAPLLDHLIDKTEKWRFKVQFLCEAQRIAFDMGLPRLSPASALIEVFFDGLYQAEVIEEKYFELWTLSNDDTAGKTKAMFQMNDFLDWLRTAPVEGETDSEEEEDGKEKGSDEEEEEDEEEDDDIEANVPQRAGLKPAVR